MRLLVIGDLHYAQPRAHAPATWTAARDTFYTAFMRTIHAMQADYVVALGDATQHGFVTEWEQMTVAYNVTARYARFWATTIRCTCRNLPSSLSRVSHARIAGNVVRMVALFGHVTRRSMHSSLKFLCNFF